MQHAYDLGATVPWYPQITAMPLEKYSFLSTKF